MDGKSFFTLLFFFFYLSNSCSQSVRPELSIGLIEPELLEGANTILRKDFGEFSVQNASQATAYYKTVVTRMNENAGYESLAIRYDLHEKVSLNKVKIRLYDASGKLIRKIDKKEIKDRSAWDGFSVFSDNRYLYVDLSYSEYPYTIEYEYERKYDGLLVYPTWRIQGSLGTSVQEMSYTVSVPSDIKLNYKVLNADIEPTLSETENRITYTWLASNLPVLKTEPLSPDIRPQILFTANKFSAEGYSGNMESWEDYGKFMYELNENRDNLSEEMKAKILELTAEAKSKQEKIDILYKYIQENMRYVSVQLGIGGWRAFDAAYVEKNKYGDCKALTWFMNSMLKELDIKSYPALVLAGEKYTRFTHFEDFSYPKFNHVILNIPEEEIWLECTNKYIPTGYLGDFTDDRSVLLITENGGKLSRTPKIPIEENSEITQTKIMLSSNGSATITCDSKMNGPKHEFFRGAKYRYSEEEFEKWFLKNAGLPSFSIEKLESTVSNDSPEAVLKYEVNVRKFGSKAGSRWFLPVNCTSVFDDVPPEMTNREYPVVIKRGYSEENQITFEIPTEFRVESIAEESLLLESEFGTYSMRIEQEPNKLIYHRKLKIFPVDLPAEQYNDLRDFYKKVAKADKMKMVLVSKS